MLNSYDEHICFWTDQDQQANNTKKSYGKINIHINIHLLQQTVTSFH